MAFILPTGEQFARIGRAVRKVEGEVTEIVPPSSGARPGWSPLVATHNSSTSTMPPYGVGRIVGGNMLGTLPAATRTVSVDRPSSTPGRDFAVCGSEPIYCESGANSDTGRRAWGQCFVYGPCIVLYSGEAPVPGDELGPVAGQWFLGKGQPPIFTVYGVADAAKKLAYGFLHQLATSTVGKLDGDLLQGGSATVSVWGGTAGSEADTGVNITARDWLMKSGDPPIAAGTEVYCLMIDSAWYVVSVSPPAPGIPFRNDASETAPAKAIMAVTGSVVGSDGVSFLTIDKPSDTDHIQYVVNGDIAVTASGGFGDAQGRCFDGSDGPAAALYDTGTPAIGEIWGAKSGQWTLSKDSGAHCGVEPLAIIDGVDKVLWGNLVRRPCPILFGDNLYFVRQAGDSGVGVQLSPDYNASVQFSVPDHGGKLYGAGVKNLYSSGMQYNDPCLQILRSGLWRITFSANLWGAVELPATIEIEVDEGGDPPHAHIYRPLGIGFSSVPTVLAESFLECQNPTGEYVNIHFFQLSMNSYTPTPAGGLMETMHTRVTLARIKNGSNLRIRVVPSFSNCTTATTAYWRCGLTIEWIAPMSVATTP